MPEKQVVVQQQQQQQPPRSASLRMSKLVPRGANERAPTFELPPFPDEETGSQRSSSRASERPGSASEAQEGKIKRVRKRKSLLDMMAVM